MAMTKVYIDQTNIPVNGTVTFSMNCYGRYTQLPWTKNTTEKTDSSNDLEMVSTFSATCPEYGCVVYQYVPSSFYVNISYCDLEGIYVKKPFSIKNFSRSPLPNCQYKPQYDDVDRKYYYQTLPGYDSCKFRYEECDQFLMKLDENKSHTDPAFTPEYDRCWDAVSSRGKACQQAHRIKLNETDLIRDPNGDIVYHFCELRFSIPSDNVTPIEVTSVPTTMNAVSHSPVTSLYCSILNFFGAKC